MTHKVKLINYLISNLGDLGQKVVISELLFFQIKDSKGVLPSAAHILKWEQYREDEHRTSNPNSTADLTKWDLFLEYENGSTHEKNQSVK